MINIKDKFIIYNYTPSCIDDLKLFELIYEVIKQGKISNNNTEYCYFTVFGKENKVCVSFSKSKSGYRIDVYNENEVNKQKMGDK